MVSWSFFFKFKFLSVFFFTRLCCCYNKSQGNLAPSLCNTNQCVHVLPSDLATWKNTVLSLGLKQKKAELLYKTLPEGLRQRRCSVGCAAFPVIATHHQASDSWCQLQQTALLPSGRDLGHGASAVQMAKLHQAGNKVVADALAFRRLEQFRNCFSFREKNKEKEKKKNYSFIFSSFFFFLM